MRKRNAAARHAGKQRHEALVMRAGEITEGRARNVCLCGNPMRLTERTVHVVTRRATYALRCDTCGFPEPTPLT